MEAEIVSERKKSIIERVNPIPGIGIAMAMVSGIFLATGSLTVKLVTSLSGIEIVVARAFFMLLIIIFIILYKKDSLIPPSEERLALIGRSVVGCISVILAYSSVKLIPLGDSQSIVFSSPVFVSILGCVLLKEPCGRVQIVAIICTLFGIFLISRPGFIYREAQMQLDTSRTIGILMALCACLGASLCFICIRKLPKTSTSVVIFWYSILCVIGGLIVSLLNKSLALPKEPLEYLYLFICGLSGLLGQGLLTFALKIEHAGPVSLARATEIVMAFIYQITILDETVSMDSAAGATIILCGVILVAIHKWYESDQQRFERILARQKRRSRSNLQCGSC